MTENVAQSVHERLGLLEDQVQVLAQAVRALAQGLEELPSQETETGPETKEKAARGARLAHELLLSQGM
jgi:hypothetical protein